MNHSGYRNQTIKDHMTLSHNEIHIHPMNNKNKEKHHITQLQRNLFFSFSQVKRQIDLTIKGIANIEQARH